MKKILIVSIFFILLVVIQVFYLDYCLNKKLSSIINNQYAISNEVQKLGINTSKMKTRYKEVLLKSRNNNTSFQPMLVLTDNSFYNSPDNKLLLAGRK